MLPVEKEHQPSPSRKTRWYKVLYIQVIIAIIIGVLLGHFFPSVGESMKPFGDAFIKLVKMIISPVIFLTIVLGIAEMTNMKVMGRVIGKSLVYFIFFSTLALAVGLLVANIAHPGSGLNIDPVSLDSSKVEEYVQKSHDASLTGFLMNIIPTTVVSPLTNGNILQTLFVAVLFGISMVLVGEKARPLLHIFENLSALVFKMVSILMRAAPIGAFGAMAFTIGKYGIGSIGNLLYLILTFYVSSILFILIILGAVARYNGFSIIKLIKYIKEEMLLVLGTSSSEAALPTLMQKMEKAGCQKSIVGIVVPTGYSFNLDGTNIYMTMAALFIAQACNIELTLQQQILLLLVAMLSSKGAAGVTGAGFITLAATISVVPSIPVAGMALILGIDRFMSECRALTNLVGNACATIVIARWEKGLDKKKLDEVLK
ncbi:dicarboxylate/amino acid:cation symporter [Snodgrassella sp. B3882]|uniref:dicarboxylate/amino acid:cation symporter n=1 Tax=Snodgrassella sp. B3882 TaxID=2818037 RepID=UPI00226A11ED|nr:dicarboxylate/amino acid:cation symporter [Snodgrassella sp. B3882]MCX8744173.1 dicarboxylate/amino acid:cation symporter [Snodgrassella sp. B3882]